MSSDMSSVQFLIWKVLVTYNNSYKVLLWLTLVEQYFF